MSSSTVRLVSVLPGLLGTYGDGGNVIVLSRRLSWRGIDSEVLAVGAGEPIPTSGDIYVLGGGEDDAQVAALGALRGSALSVAVDRGATVLAVCAGLQLLGQSLELASGERVSGLGLLDLETGRLSTRAVGETIAEPDNTLSLPLLTGFTNHAGSTHLGTAARPLGRVLSGPGNGGHGDEQEGVLQGAIIGSYLHGPLLARNPALADLILSRVVGGPLPDLVPGQAEALHDERINAQR